MIGVDFVKIKKNIKYLKLPKKRFEFRGQIDKRDLYDDYAHHPTEILATLQGAKQINKNIVVIFQPHRYSRTKALFNEFVEVLSKVDNLILLEIYPASEMPIEKYSSEDLFKEVNKLNKNITLVNGIDEAFFEFNKFKDEKYIFLTQGAGNTSLLASKFK